VPEGGIYRSRDGDVGDWIRVVRHGEKVGVANFPDMRFHWASVQRQRWWSGGVGESRNARRFPTRKLQQASGSRALLVGRASPHRAPPSPRTRMLLAANIQPQSSPTHFPLFDCVNLALHAHAALQPEPKAQLRATSLLQMIKTKPAALHHRRGGLCHPV
jgi:hypothetical protein